MARFFQTKKKSLPKKQHQQVTIARMDHQGAGIAYQNNKPIFVEGALPGETVVIQLTEEKSKYARGKLINIVHSSFKREPHFCPHYHLCC